MLPELFEKRMQEMLGDEYNAFLRGFEEEKYQALRLNPLKRGRDAKACEIDTGSAIFAKLTPVSWEKNGYYYAADDQPGKHPYHEAGVYYIQEPSAMAPVPLLEVRPGEKVLDLCAAPGGKSTQIAGYLQGEGLLVCNEIHPARARILSENIERMGVRNACVTNENAEKLAQFFPAYFDKILVDAPCSGEGMFRKNSEAVKEWSPANVELCGERQDGILDCAAEMLRPGGRLVYSTCTFAPVENEGSVSRFLERHPDFKIVPIAKDAYGDGNCDGRAEFVERPAEGITGTLRLWPHIVKGEGHYAAVLQKEGTGGTSYDTLPAGGLVTGIKEKELGDFQEFTKENLCGILQGKYLKFGDNLYLAPMNMPQLSGLKVLRPGLHLGTLKKNRFEPSHSLALALAPDEAVHVWNLDASDPATIGYLNGQTFPAEGEKGWYLICVDGFSMGWGKLAGGIMKNHYPKGLRKN